MSSSSEIEEPHGTTVCEFFQNVFLSISKPPESLDDLCDGVAMFEALSEISMDHFDPSSFGRDFGPNWALKASNLKKLVRNLEDFYHDELSKDADFDSLSSRANEIAKGEDMDGLLEIVELVMVAATLCDDRLVFITHTLGSQCPHPIRQEYFRPSHSTNESRSHGRNAGYFAGDHVNCH